MPTIPHDRQITAQLVIGRTDGVTWEDVTDYLERAEVELGNIDQIGTGNQGGDSVVRTLEFTLRNNRVYIPVWDDATAQDELYVVGDELDVVGDESDGAELLINLLFNTDNALKGDTFHPRDRESSWNQFGGSYAPLLWPNREVVLRVAIQETGGATQESGTTQIIGESVGTGDGTLLTFQLDHYPVLPNSETIYVDGVETSDYTINYDTGEITTSVSGTITADYTYFYGLFAGYLGDSIKSGENGATVICQCRDYAKRLQDTYIETVRTYGSETGTPAETVIQQILNDNGLSDIQLYCPVSPGFMILPYECEYKSVWDAIQEIASQFGWFLGFLFDTSTCQWRLTLLKPPRDKSIADYTLTAQDDFYTADLDINDADIRNVIKVIYRDASTGQRASVTVEDADSIAEYGRRAMQIEESDTSLIDTATEATNFANAALNDLKDITGTNIIEMPLFPHIDLFTALNVDDPRLSSTIDFFGVDSVRHTLEFGRNSRFTTEVVGSGRVTGAHTKWLRMQTRPGTFRLTSPAVQGSVGEVIDAREGADDIYVSLQRRNNEPLGDYTVP